MSRSASTQSVPYRRPLRVCGAFVVTVAVLVLMGWCLGMPRLASVGRETIPMAPSTAILFLLQGIAVWLRARPAFREQDAERDATRRDAALWTATILHAAAAPVALTLFALSSRGIYLQAERLGIDEPMRIGSAPVGHMSALTALCFLAAIASFLASMRQQDRLTWRSAIAFGLAAVLTLTSSILLLAYLYGSPLFYTGSVLPPSLPTAAAFLALGLAALELAAPRAWREQVRRTAPAHYSFLFSLLFAVLTVGIITLGYVEANRLESRHRTEVETLLTAIADLKVSEIDQWRNERLGEASVAFKNEAITELVRSCLAEPQDLKSHELLRTWMSGVQSSYDYDRVSLLDASGVEHSWTPDGTRPLSPFTLARAREAMASGAITLLDFYRHPEDGSVYLAIVAPVLDGKADWRPIGAFVFRVDPHLSLYPLIRKWPTPSETAETFIVGREGDEAVCLNDLRFQEGAALALREPLDFTHSPLVRAALGDEGIVEGIDYRGTPVIAALRNVPDLPWHVVAKMDLAEVFAPMRERMWTTVGFVGVLLLGTGAGLALVWRQQRLRFYQREYEAAQALRKSEALNRNLIEHLPQRIMIKDRNSCYVMCNAVYAQDLGIRPEELAGKDDYAFFPRELADAYRADDRAVMDSGQLKDIEEKYLVGGNECWIHTIKVPFSDDGGDVVGVLVIFEDITLRKQAQEALRESERFAQATLNALSSSIAIVEASGRIVAVNDAWRRFAKENGAEMRLVCEGADYLAVCNTGPVIDGDIARQAAEAIRDIASGRRDSFSMEYPCHSPEEQRWFVCLMTRFPGPGPARVVIAHENVTGRKLAELALRDSQEQLQRAVRAGGVGLWDWDVAKDKVYYSAEWKRQLGYEEDEITDSFHEWLDRLHPEDSDRLSGAIQAFLASERNDYRHEFRLRHKNGSYRWILTSATLTRDSSGAPIRMIGSHIDISERKHLEEQILQSQKMESVGRLAGGVAHDFNNLMSVINGYAEFLLKKAPKGSEMRSDLEQIRSASQRATALTRQLLAFSRKQVLQPEVLDLNMLVSNVKTMLVRLIGEDVELIFSPSANPVLVRVDPGQIEQVVINLAVNARDAMPTGGQLAIEIRPVSLDQDYARHHINTPAGDYVLMSVTDNGAGMSRETTQHLFEPFFTTKEVGKGTGLGLATVYGIVRQSGGDIVVYSEEGRGTTFKVYLPRVPDVQNAVTLDSPDQSLPQGGGETILLVEDDASLRTMSRRMLSEAGYSVLEVSCGSEALKALQEKTSDIQLMLTDVVMPGMSGRELAERARDAHPDLAIVFMSGYTGDAILRHGIAADSEHFVSKPFTIEELTGTIRNALQQGAGIPERSPDNAP